MIRWATWTARPITRATSPTINTTAPIYKNGVQKWCQVLNLALASKTDTRLNRTLSWTYDPVGNVDSKTDYQDEVTEYQYDSTYRLVAMNNAGYLHVSYHYDGAGRLIDRILSNGAKTRYRYDDDDRLTQLTNTSADGIVVENLTYTRDRVGNITRVANRISGRITVYSYDALYRLQNVDSNINTEDRGYTYDKVGNRRSRTRNGQTVVYCYHVGDCNIAPKGNRLINIRTGSPTGALYRRFEYDDSGRLLTKRDGAGALLYTVTYNGKGRAETINGIGFAYDPNDYRIQKQDNLYLLEGEHLEATYSTAGVLQNKYLRGVVVDEIVNGYTYHSGDANDWSNYTFHHDHLNSVTALTGHAGSTEETTSYDAFGGMLDQSFPGTENELLFTGRQWDEDNRLYYYRARYYDPEIGRFISEDPLGFGAGVNFYAYVGNNPVNFNDPSGNVCVPCVTGLISGTGAAIASVASGNDFFSIETAASFGAGFTVGSGFAAIGATGAVTGLVTANTSATLSGAVAVSEVFVGATGAVTGDAILQGTKMFGGKQNNFDFSRSRIAAIGGVGGSLPSVIRAGSTLPAISNLGPRATQVFMNAAEPTLGELALLGGAETGIGVGVSEASNFFSNIFSPSSASGGFVLYPNKSNTNTLQSVYSK